MVNCDRVEIVLPNMKGRVKLFQISDMHITLWNDSDTEYTRTSQKERKDMFDGLVNDGVERTEKFEECTVLHRKKSAIRSSLREISLMHRRKEISGIWKKRSIHLISKRFFA